MDFEVIIVDDGSTDDSKMIIEDYLQDLRFQYFYQHNRGSNIAYKVGSEQARGDYIVFIDQDTWVSEDAVAFYLEQLSLFPDADVIQPVCEEVSEDAGSVPIPFGPAVDRAFNGEYEIIEAARRREIAWRTTSYRAIKAKLLEPIRFVGNPAGADTRAFLQILTRCKQVVVSSRTIHFSLFWLGSQSRVKRDPSFPREWIKALDESISYYLVYASRDRYPLFELGETRDLLRNAVREYSSIHKSDADFCRVAKRLWRHKAMWLEKQGARDQLIYYFITHYPKLAGRWINRHEERATNAV